MIDPKTFALLESVYERQSYDVASGRWVHAQDHLSSADQAQLLRAKMVPDDYAVLLHDEAVKRLRSAVKKLSLEDAAKAFVAGVGGSFPRGRQTLLSYSFAIHLPEAPHDPGKNGSNGGACGVCSIEPRENVDRTGELYVCWSGGSDSESCARFVFDLEEARTHRIEPTKADRATFKALLRFIAAAPPKTNVSTLEKSILKAKLVPTKDKYVLRGMLTTFGAVGVLPNAFMKPWLDAFTTFDDLCAISRKIPGGSRSDVVPPLAGWSGGVDLKRAKQLFG